MPRFARYSLRFLKIMAENIREKIENKIIDYIVLGSGGRLLVTKPEDPGSGADLVIKRKGEYKPEKDKNSIEQIIVKVKAFASETKKSKEEIFLTVRSQKENIDISKFSAVPNFYLLLVSFDIVKQDIEDNARIVKLDESKQEFLINKKDLAQFFLNLV